MRLASVWFLAVCAAAAQAPPTNELSRIEGHVFRDDTGAPIGKTVVTLERITAKSAPDDWVYNYEVVSDSLGAYAFTGVARGRFRLRASRNGFLDAHYGAHGSQNIGAVLDLESPQKLKDIDLRLTAYGVVSGRILDADGDPVVGAKVEFLRTHYFNGKKTLTEESAPSTNDLGEFRGAGLKPGRYYVRAEEFYGTSALAISKEKYVPIFYPGAIDAAAAAPVEVAAGAQVRLGDMTLLRAPTVTAKGKVAVEIAGASGRPTVSFYPDTRIVGSNSFRSWPAKIGDGGEFVAHNLTPGKYVVTASIGQGGLWRGSAPVGVNVGAGDIDGIVLRIRDEIVTKAAVRVEGDASLNWTGVRWKVRRGGPAGDGSGSEWGSSVAANGTFQIEETEPARYGVTLTNLPDGYYMKSVRLGQSDITYTGFDLREGPAGELDILVSHKAGGVSGVSENADGSPALGATVVLVPQEKERAGIAEYYPQATSDQFGRFNLKNVPPGDYKAYAWDDVEATAWLDSDFLAPFERDGVPLKVEESGHTAIEVKITGETPPAKR